MALPLTRVLLIATALCLSHVPAHAQGAELVEVHLLAHPDAPAQSATFEIVNESDHEISSLAVSCRLLNEAGKAIAVKVVRFRHHGLALNGLDGVEQVEAVVISALCYLQS